MIVEGVKLMVVGMTTVMLFLTLMVMLITMVAYLTRGVTARELQEMLTEKARRKRERELEQSAEEGEDTIAVVSAAIAAYEAERASAAR